MTLVSGEDFKGAVQVALVVKNASVNAGYIMRQECYPWVGKISWRRACQPTSVFLPGESHEHRSLQGYSPESLSQRV